ncbi:GNAT family N-acetyltransferase [Alloscardovia theropitheci]|uniref:GNAT family N-acetyltransferase n=1 Tax=Alloscardovia theropitheci TaxID=2496842 RepID=A0A4R0QVX8_9BIFI|nr:GNAT family N-acetyltransferase [Alloscardovia theropitheci]TCD54447.1 GNAT family N-acetyltransferase [Alloscardovia theropitheci]
MVESEKINLQAEGESIGGEHVEDDFAKFENNEILEKRSHQHLIEVRKATIDDLPEIMNIVNDAKRLLKEDGSSQWQNGYPNEFTFISDIDAGASYVITVDSHVAGTTMISFGEEAGYSAIHGGTVRYPVDEYGQYAVLHRAAMSTHYRGMRLIDQFFKELFRVIDEHGTKVVRVDTHRKNFRMQRVLDRLGMTPCGFVTLDHDPEDPVRICYEGSVKNLLGLI